MAKDRRADRHRPDSVTLTLRVRRAWLAAVDAAARAAGASRNAYIRRAVEARLAAEGQPPPDDGGANVGAETDETTETETGGDWS